MMGNYDHAMNDNETLATEPDAVVLSIGIQLFDPAHHLFGGAPLGPSFYAVLSRDEQHTRRSSPQTLAWWAEQSPEARRLFDEEQARVTPTLLELNEFLERHAGMRDKRMLWGNGAAFDNVVLKDLYRWAGVPFPFKYHNDRCYRTLRALSPEDTASAEAKSRRVNFHNAADDARYQAEVAVRLLRKQMFGRDSLEALAVLCGHDGNLCGIHPGPELDELQAAFSQYDEA